MVVVCEKMMNRACWAKSKHLIHSKTFRGMTLLHLAAGQGYATLIQTLIKWRSVKAIRALRSIYCTSVCKYVFPLSLLTMRIGIILSSTKHADSIDLELEVDPLNVDHFSCTPLVCSSSHFNCTLVHLTTPLRRLCFSYSSFYSVSLL